MNRSEIISMFDSRSEAMIKAWPRSKEKNPFDLPQGPNREILIQTVQELHKKKRVTSVLDVGGGLGRWVPFWLEGIGVKGKYTLIEPAARLAAEAEKRHGSKAKVEVLPGDLVSLDSKLGRQTWDVGFTFTALEHMPFEEAAKTAEIMKRRCKRIIMIEMVEATKKAGWCGYVFKHDHRKLFGEPSFQRMLDENKALLIWG